ncbi:hypothetical protein ACFLTH_03310 [Bacteroidota bacterium]
MKKLFSVKCIVLFLFVFSISNLTAQSDYQITQDFKNGITQLSDSIKSAVDYSECLKIDSMISVFKVNFSEHKDLLAQSLYPDTYESALEKLETQLTTRKNDYAKISDLQLEVENLKFEISDLNRMNTSFLREIRILENKKIMDQNSLDSLSTLVNNLRSSIRKRDDLVLTIIDSLVTEFVNTPSTLNEAESQQFIKKIDSENIFFNVRRTIEDNIQFLEVTSLTFDDLHEVKKHQMEFSQLWRQIGSKMAEVYLKRNEKAIEIGQIDGLFREWDRKINYKVWTTIDRLFQSQDIRLLEFENGTQFTDNVTLFIENEIKNTLVKESDEAEELFNRFTYKVWFNDIKPNWIPVLIENEMLTVEQKDSIESKITKWQNIAAPPSFTWLFWLIGIILLAALLLMFFKWDSIKPKKPDQKAEK